jgi:hypothetical protein
MRRAVRAKQESEKLVLDDKYVGDSLKSQIDAHASACNPAHGAISLIAPASPQRPRLMVWTPARLYAASQWAKDLLSNIRTKQGGSEMEVTTIGIDLAKNVFAVRGADGSGRVVMRRQLRRVQVVGNAWAAAPHGEDRGP